MPAKLVEYLATTRIGERGTMTLPKDYCDELQLETGAALTILRIGDGLMLIPEQKRFSELCDSIAGKLERVGVADPGDYVGGIRNVARHAPPVKHRSESRSCHCRIEGFYRVSFVSRDCRADPRSPKHRSRSPIRSRRKSES